LQEEAPSFLSPINPSWIPGRGSKSDCYQSKKTAAAGAPKKKEGIKVSQV
jgi:hypothetical protein